VKQIGEKKEDILIFESGFYYIVAAHARQKGQIRFINLSANGEVQ